MEKIVRYFNSFEDSDLADYQAYATMTAEKRLEIAIHLRWMCFDEESEAAQRLARVYRFTSLSEG